MICHDNIALYAKNIVKLWITLSQKLDKKYGGDYNELIMNNKKADNTIEQTLMQTGLSKDQAALYEALVQHGSMSASDAASRARVSRTLGYKLLGELQALGLVEKKDEPGAVAVFAPAHPLKLKELADKRLEQAQDARQSLDGVIVKMVSAFNIMSGKPGVQFFEGLAGVKAVLDDSLTSRTEILSYADLESIEKYNRDVNKEYVSSCKKFGVNKRSLVLDTPFVRSFLKGYASEVTQTKLISSPAKLFHTVMQIYDNKISYITLSDAGFVSLIITDPNIYEMHRIYFEHLWSVTSEFVPEK